MPVLNLDSRSRAVKSDKLNDVLNLVNESIFQDPDDVINGETYLDDVPYTGAGDVGDFDTEGDLYGKIVEVEEGGTKYKYLDLLDSDGNRRTAANSINDETTPDELEQVLATVDLTDQTAVAEIAESLSTASDEVASTALNTTVQNGTPETIAIIANKANVDVVVDIAAMTTSGTDAAAVEAAKNWGGAVLSVSDEAKKDITKAILVNASSVEAASEYVKVGAKNNTVKEAVVDTTYGIATSPSDSSSQAEKMGDIFANLDDEDLAKDLVKGTANELGETEVV